MKEAFKLGTLTADPGEKVSGYLGVAQSEVQIPVTLICGIEEGETILVCGGVHNAEYVGIQAAIELAEELEPEQIRGNVVIVRLANRTGFEHRTMSLVYEDGKNLNRVFPGAASGTLAERIAFTFESEIYPRINYFIDLHSGDGFEGMEPYVYCLGNADDHVRKVSREMAQVAHVKYLVESMSNSGGAYNYAGKLGIPSILLERGGSAVWCREQVEEDKQDVKNIMRYLGILEGEARRPEKQPTDVSPVTYADAGASGCWYPKKQPGETFQKDEVLGEIRDYFGNVLQTYRAQHGGIVLYETVSLCIMKDTPMVAYGQWNEDTMGKIEKACRVCGKENQAEN